MFGSVRFVCIFCVCLLIVNVEKACVYYEVGNKLIFRTIKTNFDQLRNFIQYALCLAVMINTREEKKKHTRKSNNHIFRLIGTKVVAFSSRYSKCIACWELKSVCFICHLCANVCVCVCICNIHMINFSNSTAYVEVALVTKLFNIFIFQTIVPSIIRSRSTWKLIVLSKWIQCSVKTYKIFI